MNIFASRFKDKLEENWFYIPKSGNWEPLRWEPGNQHSPLWLSKLKGDTHDGLLRSSGPWWVDPHHTSPGIGWLEVIAVSFWKGYRETCPIEQTGWAGGRVPESIFALGSEKRPIDLAGATVTVRVRGDIRDAPEGSWLAFGFQANGIDAIERRNVTTHYINTQNQLHMHPKRWTTHRFELRPYDSDWVCLGQESAARTNYGCARSVKEVISNVDIGLMFLLINGHLKPNGPVKGFVEFDTIKVVLHGQSPA